MNCVCTKCGHEMEEMPTDGKCPTCGSEVKLNETGNTDMPEAGGESTEGPAM